MKFFNIDLHISVIADIKKIFTDLGHEVDDWSLSDHAWVFGRQRKHIDVINHSNWTSIDENMCNAFYDRYCKELQKYDAFIVTHTPCLSMLYKKFNKPIIVVCSTRYEQPFSSDMVKWKKFNNYLIDGVDRGQIILLANNKYDKKYTELFLNREVGLIPSICDYTGSKYTDKNNKFLYSSKFKSQEIIKTNESLADKNEELGLGYSWKEFFSYSGVVHIPYNASTMSIFEQYTANMPLFFPTLEFLSFLREKHYNTGVMSELSWNQVFSLSSHSVIGPMFDDPNNYLDNEQMSEWTKLSDFYDTKNMPHIQYFKSFEHLNYLLKTCDLKEISKNMQKHNIIRKMEIYKKWQQIIQKISNQ